MSRIREHHANVMMTHSSILDWTEHKFTTKFPKTSLTTVSNKVGWVYHEPTHPDNLTYVSTRKRNNKESGRRAIGLKAAQDKLVSLELSSA